MEAEELLISIKKHVESLDYDGEVIILPTKGNPNEQQYDVSLIIMEKVDDGRIPRFTVNVKDNNYVND